MRSFLLVQMPLADPRFPQYTLAYVSSIVKKTGWKCLVQDVNIELYNRLDAEERLNWGNDSKWCLDARFQADIEKRYGNILAELTLGPVREHQPDIIGFSVTEQSRYFSLWAADMISRQRVPATVLFGGPDCFPFEYGAKFLAGKRRPHIVLQGEAEVALVEFLNEWDSAKGNRTNVKGFLFIDDGQLVDTGRPQLPNLRKDRFVADYGFCRFSDYSLHPDAAILTTFISKGCVNRCAFCNEHINYGPFRLRMALDVFNEMKESIQHASKYASSSAYFFFLFADSIFNAAPHIVEELCGMIIESGLEIRWRASASFGGKMSSDLLLTMRKSGCVELFWGLESASSRVIAGMGKNFSVERARDLLGAAERAGIRSDLALVTGFPGESTEDFVETLAFVIEFSQRALVHFAFVSPLQVKPNSLLARQPETFCLADTSEHSWSTRDNRNTLAVRQLRRLILLAAIAGFEGPEGELQELEKLLSSDREPVGLELARLVEALGNMLNVNPEGDRRPGMSDRMKRLKGSLTAGSVVRRFFPKRRANGRRTLEELRSLLKGFAGAVKESAQSGEKLPDVYEVSVRGRVPDREDPTFNLELVDVFPAMDGGSPEPKSQRFLRLRGWVIDERDKSCVRDVYAEIDGVLYPAHYGLPREDVAKHFRSSRCRDSGFYSRIPVELVGAGSHVLRLMMITREDNRLLVTRPISIDV